MNGHYREDESAIFKSRDAEPILELIDPLYQAGYRYGSSVMLYPEDERSISEHPTIRRMDCLVLPTRPPLSDNLAEKATRRSLPAAKCEFQERIFTGLKRFLEACSRKTIVLTPEALSWLSEDAGTKVKLPNRDAFRTIEFYEYSTTDEGNSRRLCGAELMAYHTANRKISVPLDRGASLTLVYFIRIEELPEFKCKLICCFGLNAMCTLIWSRIVRLKFPHWLTTSGDRFALAALHVKRSLMTPNPQEKPITPMFNDGGDYAEATLLTRE